MRLLQAPNRPLFMLSLAASIGPASASKLAARNGHRARAHDKY